ncbi:GCN5-related N-acetyltransferase [Natrialba asiatica DSM 12278]|uniref:GCN5-related N-acetyltransferase n=1 Tax=Natrialba asiatica (strain ATCC 700177 / DSM 12278 / JCM 9576 / FERM P-10747 / NBRC 102637 / 172P1) TaxID=29540 RepID=M0APP1_NATA1|nr:GCN5-related N-acetyltransferase [Natrialba asiatica DSM 12278]
MLSVLSVQGYRNAYAVTTLPNPASVALHERFGFEPVGTFPAVGYKHGRWHDIRWWYRRLDPESAAKPDPNRESAASESESTDPSHPADPALPMPLPDLRARDGDELGAALRVGESSLS